MDKIKLLIVDDVEDNRLVLKAACRRLEGFEIQEAADGEEAVAITKNWNPDIILMDVLMPKMDGFEASRIIKKLYPKTVILVITAVVDGAMQKNMSDIGIDTYINKPIDKDLIRFKLQTIGLALRLKKREHQTLSAKEALNPFNADIRSFRTIFTIVDSESMMDFGMWLYEQCNSKETLACNKFDTIIELFYKLMSKAMKKRETVSIIIEESYEELYLTMKFSESVVLEADIVSILEKYYIEYILQDTIFCVRLEKALQEEPQEQEIYIFEEKVTQTVEKIQEQTQEREQIEEVAVKEVRIIESKEKDMLRQSFVNKTSAADYVDEIGGDVLDEILDLASLDEQWLEKLSLIEQHATKESLIDFANNVLNVYVRALNNLFEFTALAYALSSLSAFIKDSAEVLSQDTAKIRTLAMLLEHLGTDLSSWREHIFVLQDTADIHYLDSSFFSSCMQIEGIISDKKLDVEDENDLEFF